MRAQDPAELREGEGRSHPAGGSKGHSRVQRENSRKKGNTGSEMLGQEGQILQIRRREVGAGSSRRARPCPI